MLTASILVVVPLCFAFAALSDIFTMTIPNRVPLIMLGAFILIAPFSDLGWINIGMSVAAGFAVLAVCFVLFAFNTMGGGDAKLLATSAIWFGLNMSLASFLVCVAVIGGVLTVGILLLRSRSHEIMAIGLALPDSLLVAKKVPYGVAIAIGGLLTYPEAPIVQLAMKHML